MVTKNIVTDYLAVADGGYAQAYWTLAAGGNELRADRAVFSSTVGTAGYIKNGHGIYVPSNTGINTCTVTGFVSTTRVTISEAGTRGLGRVVTMSIGSPCQVNDPNSFLQANSPVQFMTTGALPTGLAENTTYYVKTVIDESNYTLSATPGGAAINTSGTQSGTHRRPDFCMVVWGTNNMTNFDNFRNDWAGTPGVTLQIPAGIFYVGYGNPLFHGFSDLTVQGAGKYSSYLACGPLNLTTFGQIQNNLSDARTRSAYPGQNYVDVITQPKTTVSGLRDATGGMKTVTMTIASPCNITDTAHGFAPNTPVLFTNDVGGLPTGISPNVTYYVKTVVSVDVYTISATPGGAAINTSGTQTPPHYRHKVVTMSRAAPCVITDIGHSLSVGDAVGYVSTGTMLISAFTNYYVLTVLSADTYTIAPYRGGPAIDTSPNSPDIETGSHYRHGRIRLTVGSTAGYVTGQRYRVNHVGGTTEANDGFALVAVVDGTHLDLTDFVQYGGYSSGGAVGDVMEIFTVGAWNLMTGIDIQGNGYPTNHQFFEYCRLSAIDNNPASPTYGRLTFDIVANQGQQVVGQNTLKNTYLSTWPVNYAGRSQSLSPDYGGPATIYQFHPEFNGLYTINDLGIAMDFEFGAAGRDIIFNRVSFPTGGGNFGGTGAGPFASANINYLLNDCDLTGNLMELDKYVDRCVFDNCAVGVSPITGFSGVVFCQSASTNLLQFQNGTSINQLIGSTKNFQIFDSTIQTASFSPAVGLGVQEQIVGRNATINSISTFVGTRQDNSGNGINLGTLPATMSGGVIKFPALWNSGLPIAGMVPGAILFWTELSNFWAEFSFVVQDIWRDANGDTNVRVAQSSTFGAPLGGFPPFPFGSTKIGYYQTYGPRGIFTNCTGTDGVMAYLSAADQQGQPIFSRMKGSFVMGTVHANEQPKIPVIGRLTRLSINVVHEYTGAGALTFAPGSNYPVLNGARNATPPATIFYSPIVNAKIPGERVITPAGVTLNGAPGGGSGDTGLALPDPITWLTGGPASSGPKFSADVADTAVQVIVSFEADQGYDLQPPAAPSQRMGVFVVTY